MSEFVNTAGTLVCLLASLPGVKRRNPADPQALSAVVVWVGHGGWVVSQIRFAGKQGELARMSSQRQSKENLWSAASSWLSCWPLHAEPFPSALRPGWPHQLPLGTALPSACSTPCMVNCSHPADAFFVFAAACPRPPACPWCLVPLSPSLTRQGAPPRDLLHSTFHTTAHPVFC